jgi:hypothetical protein
LGTTAKIYLFLYIDIENIDGNGSGTMNSKTTELEGEDEKIQEQSVSEDEIVEEETSQTNSMFFKQIIC